MAATVSQQRIQVVYNTDRDAFTTAFNAILATYDGQGDVTSSTPNKYIINTTIFYNGTGYVGFIYSSNQAVPS